MYCPIHGSYPAAPPPTEQEEIDIPCPECRRLWLERGELYELPPRDPDEEHTRNGTTPAPEA